MTLLLIEHDMDVALRVAERVVVMADGVMIAAGTPDEIRSDRSSARSTSEGGSHD